VAVAVATGCQVFVPNDVQQCESDGDCAARGGDFAGNVCKDSVCIPPGDTCIGNVVDPIEDRAKPLHIRLRFGDLTGKGQAKVPVLVCVALDEACANPVGAPVLTDADGYAYLTIWQNFHGTIQVTSPPAGVYKIKIHFMGPVTVDQPPTVTLPNDQTVILLDKSIAAQLLASAGPSPPGAGLLFGQTEDCTGGPRGGVSITARGLGTPLVFYFNDQRTLPLVDATETASKGIFGVANVPPGALDLDATIALTGKRLAHTRIFINADTLSNLALPPTP